MDTEPTPPAPPVDPKEEKKRREEEERKREEKAKYDALPQEKKMVHYNCELWGKFYLLKLLSKMFC